VKGVMEKKHIIRFLNEKKRGAYTLMVEMYANVISSMAVTMALELIKEDLEKDSGEAVELHYFSLARAINRFKKKTNTKLEAATEREWKFRDAHEIKEGQSSPGKFKVG
jgi:3-oxoacyl-[acyl-carrier-protein] synthase III